MKKNKKKTKKSIRKKIITLSLYLLANPFRIIKGLFIFIRYGPKVFSKKIKKAQKNSFYLSQNYFYIFLLSVSQIFYLLKTLFTNEPKKLKNKFSLDKQYQILLKKNYPTKNLLIKQALQSKKFKYQPKISIIIPTHNPISELLHESIKSVINQSYSNWELYFLIDILPSKKINDYIKEDKRIKYLFKKKNAPIFETLNDSIKLSTGEYVGFLNTGDELSPNALYEIISILNKHKKIDFIYSDEDKINEKGRYFDPFFKPGWSPDLLLSFNYIGNFSLFKKNQIIKIDGFRKEFYDESRYDLILRVTEIAKKIYHIPKILYKHRPKLETKNKYKINKIILEDTIKRRGLKAKLKQGKILGSFFLNYKLEKKPLVSIIIPTKDQCKLLKKSVKSVLDQPYKNYEIIIVNNNSQEKETFNYFRKVKKLKKIKVINYFKLFNISKIFNFAVKKSRGEYILLLNNDIEAITKIGLLKWLARFKERILEVSE